MSGEHHHCVTCADEATAMRVVTVADRDSQLAVCVGEDGAPCTVDIGLLPDATVGESLLVHAGAALTRLPRAPSDRG
jgi:hydrogenase maturation factor